MAAISSPVGADSHVFCDTRPLIHLRHLCGLWFGGDASIVSNEWQLLMRSMFVYLYRELDSICSMAMRHMQCACGNELVVMFNYLAPLDNL